MARRADRVLVPAAGVAALAAYGAVNGSRAALGSPQWLLFVGIGAAAYVAIILRLALGRSGLDRPILLIALVFAGAFRVPFLMTGPGADVYRYVWDARVQRLGHNPYVLIPSDPALGPLHTDETRRLNHPDLPTVYPPGAQLMFRSVFAFGERAQVFKWALALVDALVVLMLWRWLAAAGVHAGWLLAYAWNPLVIVTTAGEGHMDLLGVAWLLASVLLLIARRTLLSAVCLAMAIAIKPLPLVLLPLYWRSVRMRDAAVAVLLLIVLYAPYTTRGHVPIGSLGVFLQTFRFNQTAFVAARALLGPRGAALAAAGVGFTVAAVLRRRTRLTDGAAWCWPLAAAIVMSPVVYPWYLVWLAPFLVGVATLPLVAWSVTVLITYAVWHLARAGGPWAVPPVLLLVEFIPPIAIAAWLVVRRGATAPRPRSRPRTSAGTANRLP